MIKNSRLRFILFTTVTLLAFFQNCGQVSIEMASVEPIRPFASTQMSAEGCVNSVKMEAEKTKFIFVLDLSRSNMGEFYVGSQLFNGVLYPGAYFFDPGKGTDTMGARFDSIANFVNTCGNSPRNDYAVIAFSNAAGEIEKIGGDYSLNCKNRFVSSSSVAQQLTLMKEAQAKEALYYDQFKEPNTPFLAPNATDVVPFIFKETNYVAATDCIASTIEADLTQTGTNDTSNYQIFFLSDGEAQAKSTLCEEPGVTNKPKCYIDKMDEKLSYMMKLSSAKSKPIRIHALYYTRSGSTNLAIETYMNYLSAIGQTNSPINLGSFQNGSNNAENPFCKLIAVDKSIVYRTNKIYAVNTSLVKIGKEQKLDGDSDGIIDDDEESYSADATEPRSMVPGVLDGVCKIVGNKTLCQEAKDKITCDANLINGFGLSDCDVKILKLTESAARPELAGIDSDNDGLPDYVEIIKGLSPINADSYLDYDVDGLTNLQEISMGLDPFTPDVKEDSIIFSSSVFKDQIDQCTSGGWHLDITSLGGEPGINKLLLFFRTESKNTQGLFEYRKFDSGYQLKLLTNGSYKIDLNDANVNVDQFELVIPIAGGTL